MRGESSSTTNRIKRKQGEKDRRIRIQAYLYMARMARQEALSLFLKKKASLKPTQVSLRTIQMSRRRRS
jgi:hypothetical protein